MCGFAGWFAGLWSGWEAEEVGCRLERRGPDDAGEWVCPEGMCHLVFRRLAIVDLSEAGHQPMVSHDEGSVLVFNGEVYNFRELRVELEREGRVFRSGTDTEVVLEGLQTWGRGFLGRLNGMFGLAWYDRRARTVLLARDHAGIKPLYWRRDPAGGGVAFSSQLNCLVTVPWGGGAEVDAEVLEVYLRWHHVPPALGLLRNTGQVAPGGWIEVGPGGAWREGRWWSLPDEAPESDLHGEEALEGLGAVLDRAVRRQRIADVPLGVYLSGGVDSPLVTAVARRQTDGGLRAFTIGNPGWGQDEGAMAAAYAARLDVTHRLTEIRGEDALAVLGEVREASYEPLGDFSIVPTLLVSRLARTEVTVVLSGDGGDELFFGYERPWSLLRHAGDWRWPGWVRRCLYGAGKIGLLGRRSGSLLAPSPGAYYSGVNSRLSEAWLRRLAPDLRGGLKGFDLYAEPATRGIRDLAHFSRRAEYYGQMQRCLKKVDMASMHNSLEVRVPLLDREVVELSLRLDPMECLRGGERKAPLRDLLAREVGEELISRRKMGFSVPLAGWLRGPWKGVVEDTLFGGKLMPSGMFDVRELRTLWNEHLEGRADHKWTLWTLLSLQWWAQRWLGAPSR
ncbi:MAG: asparagine synthase (glutamine-hydrolyzing) [Verrucomicrobiae bacterium]|nr:asparagine synthase (glutamine-hydrolyzing) [Verrucomicrobiae bacterium]